MTGIEFKFRDQKFARNCILAFTVIACMLTSAYSHPGVGIVKDSKGNIFYTDLNHVWKISPSGDRSIAVENVHTHQLYMDDQDNLFGEHEWYKGEQIDKWGNYVWSLNNDGCFEIILSTEEGFLHNNTLVRDKRGASYWSKGSDGFEIIMKANESGTNVVFSDHSFTDIRWMYFSNYDDRLYVVDRLQLMAVSQDGTHTVIADNLKEDIHGFAGVSDRHYVFGIWTDDRDGIYAAIFGAGKIRKFDSAGSSSVVFESEEDWSPCGGLTDSKGTHWILEYSKANRARVVKLESNGNKTIYGA